MAEAAEALDQRREITDASLDAERVVGGDEVAASELRVETDANLAEERIESDRVVELSQEPFRLLADQVQDYAIFMLDGDGRVTSWNVGAQRLKGYRSDEIIGRSFTVFYSAEDRAAGLPQVHLRDARATGRVEAEGLRVRKDGSTFMANMLLTAFHDQTGVFRGFIKITRDLSEQVSRAERELQGTREKLRVANEHLATVATMHDVAEASRSVHQRIVERVTAALGRPAALYVVFVVVVAWIAGNVLTAVAGLEPPDAAPFFWLQGLIGVYAAVVTTGVLITQTRQQTQAKQRAMLELQVNLAAEQKTAKIIGLLEELRRDLPSVPSRIDAQAEAMARSIDPVAAMAALEATLGRGKRT